MKEFENKVALVTGGSTGIGRATSLAFAQKGAKVVIASRRVEDTEETLQLVKEAGSEAIFVKTDVTKATDIENLISKAVETYGRIDYAFNNAGIEGKIAPILDLTEEDWDNVIDTNLKGTWLLMKHQIPQMLKQGGGAIVNNSSSFGLVGYGHLSPYCASKHGVIGLTKSLALEYATAGIRINIVCPGAIATEMQDRVSGTKEARAQMIAAHPIGRIGEAKEVAGAVMWLCSDTASFVTGHSLAVDGGFTVQ